MSKNYKKYTESTYSGKRLLEQHALDEQGLWHIHGEDPNCDFGGSHHQPDLGIVEGRLGDVIAYAVELPNFWNWGAGGSITKLGAIPKITPQYNAHLADLLAQERELKARLEQIRSEIKGKKNA